MATHTRDLSVSRHRFAHLHNKIGFQQQVKESEMRALRAQMNPHFIFNSLNSINAYILCNQPKEASTYLTKFADLMRQVLDHSAQETISLEEEIHFIHAYLQTECLRLEQKLTHTIKVDDSVDTFAALIPSMLLQPYLENAIWHGIAHKQSCGHIEVNVRRASNMLIISIEDDGIGRMNALQLRAAHTQQHVSRGLKITAERLALHDQKHGCHSSVQIIDLFDGHGNAAGTRVEICIA